jgi:hypothetical protein
MVQRFLKDESGIMMGLAIMMILLISVMGAGLLTFVSRDLNTVIETNRGQRAFEVADAGVAAAKRQLVSTCVGNFTCSAYYNGDGAPTEDNICGADDLQWSALRCDDPVGLTLKNLDGVDGTADDYAIVTIQYMSDTDDFKVISTGFYGDAKRKIEAIFRGTAGGGGGGNVINPAYYAPGDIRLWGDATGGVLVNGISLFSERNIIMEGLRPYSQCGPPTIEEPSNPRRPPDTYPSNCLITEYAQDGGVITAKSHPGRSELGDWDSRKFFDNDVPDLTWNTQGRVKRNGREEKDPGFAAEGLICGSSTTVNCDDATDSIAEGRHGYDSTTGTKGQLMTFIEKTPPDFTPQDPGTITYPFQRQAPDAARLKQLAINRGSFYRGANPEWDTLLGNGRRVVFIDAEDAEEPLTLDPVSASGADKGIIVVWCGSLKVNNLGNSGFKGIIMTLNGSSVEEGLPLDPPPSGEESTSCGADQGYFRSQTPDRADPSAVSSLQAWLYAEGEDDPLTPDIIEPSIDLGPGTQMDFLPSGQYRLLNLVLQDPIVTDFTTEGWRECYQLSPATECGT